MRSNDISYVVTIDQEIFFDQSQFVSVVILVFSLAFCCFVSVLLENLLYLNLPLVSVFVQKLSQHNEKEQSHYFPLENVNKHDLFLTLSQQLILLVPSFPRMKSGNMRTATGDGKLLQTAFRNYSSFLYRNYVQHRDFSRNLATFKMQLFAMLVD